MSPGWAPMWVLTAASLALAHRAWTLSAPRHCAADAHDRAAERRADEAWLEERWADPATRVLVVAGDAGPPGRRRAAVGRAGRRPAEGSRVLLGERDGRTWFALLVDPDDAPGDRGE